VAEKLFHIRYQERAQQQNERERDGRVEYDPERARVRRLERPTHGSNDLRVDSWDLGEITLCDSSKERFHRRLGKAGVCSGGHDVLGQVLAQLVCKDRRVQGCGNGATEAAYGAQDAGCEADVLCLPDERDTREGDVLDEANGCDVLVRGR